MDVGDYGGNLEVLMIVCDMLHYHTFAIIQGTESLRLYEYRISIAKLSSRLVSTTSSARLEGVGR